MNIAAVERKFNNCDYHKYYKFKKKCTQFDTDGTKRGSEKRI